MTMHVVFARGWVVLLMLFAGLALPWAGVASADNETNTPAPTIEMGPPFVDGAVLQQRG